MAFKAKISPVCFRLHKYTDPKAPCEIGAIISKSERRGYGRGGIE